MNQNDLVNEIAARSGLNKTVALAAVQAMKDTVVSAMARGENVVIREFGCFEPVIIKAHKGRDFQTGGTIDIPARPTVKFKPGTIFHATTKR